MTSIPRTVRRATPAPGTVPSRSLFDILGTLGPGPGPAVEAAPFRAACVLEAARRGRPVGPRRPTPHGAAPPATRV